MIDRLIQVVRGIATRRTLSPAEYWRRVNVTQHYRFTSAEESLDYFHWRNDQYVNYLEMMPVSGQDGRVVLDYGCGPGHDVVGFGHFSNPERLIGMEVSSTSLKEARARVALHGINAELMLIDENDAGIPLDDDSVDYIHSSGVMHHIRDPFPVFRELRRVLKPDGEIRVMVYNYDSIFVHLYVAYLTQIKARTYHNEPLREAFRHLTDGENCPVSHVYSSQEFSELAGPAGFSVENLGAALSMFELSLLPQRFDAILDRHLDREHRQFLLALKFDDAGLPLYKNQHAGIDGCYRLSPV